MLAIGQRWGALARNSRLPLLQTYQETDILGGIRCQGILGKDETEAEGTSASSARNRPSLERDSCVGIRMRLGIGSLCHSWLQAFGVLVDAERRQWPGTRLTQEGCREGRRPNAAQELHDSGTAKTGVTVPRSSLTCHAEWTRRDKASLGRDSRARRDQS